MAAVRLYKLQVMDKQADMKQILKSLTKLASKSKLNSLMRQPTTQLCSSFWMLQMFSQYINALIKKASAKSKKMNIIVRNLR